MDLQYGDNVYDREDVEYTVVHVDDDNYVVAWQAYDDGRVHPRRHDIGFTGWIKKQVRKGEVIYPVPASTYEYGDKVVHKNTPDSTGVVIERKDNTTYVVAFNGSRSHGPSLETHQADKLLDA